MDGDAILADDGANVFFVSNEVNFEGAGIQGDYINPSVGGTPSDPEYFSGTFILGAVATKVDSNAPATITIGYDSTDADHLTGYETTSPEVFLTFGQTTKSVNFEGGNENVA